MILLEGIPTKKIQIIFNDLNNDKISRLKDVVSDFSNNVFIDYFSEDANQLLKKIKCLIEKNNTHYLLFYDPYDAKINWNVICPFINSWGEVILNHMVSDSIRAIKMVKSSEAVQKYEMTYQSSIDELIPYGSDKEAYEKRIQEIIKNLSKRTQYYVSSFPLFNKNNSLLYDLIHCTSNKEGFKLFKKCAWKTFEGKSSNKNLHDHGCKTWVSIEPYPTPNIFKQDLNEILEQISFVDKVIFGKLNYNKEVSKFKNYKIFYNEQAELVHKFCKINNIQVYIKNGTISEK